MGYTTDAYATIVGNGKTIKLLLAGEVKEDWEKDLQVIPVPNQSGKTLLIDLVKLKHVITVTGFLLNEKTNAYGNPSMQQKKQDLYYILKKKGTMTLTWDSNDPNQAQPYTVNILKLQVAERLGNLEAAEPSETKHLNVQIQFVEGVHKG